MKSRAKAHKQITGMGHAGWWAAFSRHPHGYYRFIGLGPGSQAGAAKRQKAEIQFSPSDICRKSAVKVPKFAVKVQNIAVKAPKFSVKVP